MDVMLRTSHLSLITSIRLP